MQASSPSHFQDIRMAAMLGGAMGYSPRDERFDRITRTVKRVLQVPIAVLTTAEDDQQWFRSVQGLEPGHAADDMVFCGQVVASGLPVIVNDTWADPAFADSPLVMASPAVRSYVGWPIETAPGVVAGALCGIDTIPRQFSEDEIAGLKDLARIAECELRSHATASLHRTLLMRLELVQRRHALDPFTGCWSIRGFRELLGFAVPQAQADATQLALCHLRVEDVASADEVAGEMGRTSILAVLAQLLRERLPVDGALARLGEADFCAMVPAPTALALERLLAPLMAPELGGILPDGRQLDAWLNCKVVRLADLGPEASASRLWATMLADAPPSHY